MKRPDWREWLRNKAACKSWLEGYRSKGVLRKAALTPDVHLKRAKHNLDFGNWVKDAHREEIPKLFGEERFYDWVISAYYYSIYHTALALIAARGLASKSHSATLCGVIWYYFHKAPQLAEKDIELIGKSIEAHKGIDTHDIELIARTKTLRERASYDASATFEESLVERTKGNAIRILNKVRDILKL